MIPKCLLEKSKNWSKTTICSYLYSCQILFYWFFFFFTVIVHWQDKPMFGVLKTKRQSLCFSVYGEWALCTTQGSKSSAYALHMHTDRYLSFKMFTAFRKSVGNKLVSFSSVQHLHSFVVKAISQGVTPYRNDVPWNKLWEKLF